MLAQPEGNASYDRISWAGFATPMALIASALLVGVIANSLPSFGTPSSSSSLEQLEDRVLHEAHVAKLGSELFARHLISVEVVGTILLVALVGAIAIVIQGKPRRRSAEEGAAS
jgi:NADH:ubiquinone oxidoreductase subunit 6 (subunit J)